MAWNVLVSYLKEPKILKRHSSENGDEILSDSSPNLSNTSSLSGDSMEADSNKTGDFLSLLPKHFNTLTARLAGSVESLETSQHGSVSLSPNCRPREGLTRSGSIRICDSPLHRGSQLGSPAFRRKKRKTKRYCSG